VDFKLFTGTLKAYETESGDRFVSGTTSSTIRDLHGDAMAMSALKSMEETAKQNMTVFLNHNYNVPEDLFGSATDARIVKRVDGETGEEVYDLDIDVKVCPEDENPQAMQAYRAIKRGVKLGLSIGARVENADKKRDEKSGVDTYVINKVRLLEASVVGIPANQRSYLHNAVKSLRSGADDLDVFVKAESVSKGDFVSWKSSGGTARGQVQRVIRDGRVSIPDSDFEVIGTEEDPAALIRVWRQRGEGWAPSDVIVGHKVSTLDKIEALRQSEKSVSDEFADGNIVVAEGTASEGMEKNMSEEIAPQAVEEAPVAEETAEHAAEPAAEVVAEETPVVALEAESAVAAEPTAEEAHAEAHAAVDEYREVSEADVAEVVAEVLASATSNRLALETGAPIQGEAVPAAGPVAAEPVAEEVAPEAAPAEAAPNDAVIEEPGAEPASEDQGVEPVVENREEAEKSADVDDISKLVTVAKSALDAAFKAQQEVESLRKENTELAAAKAKVEKDLESANSIIDRMSAEPVGRKLISKATEQRHSDATWLHPYIQRVLEAQD
jgi:HK97 family phage prohead protease